MLLWKNNLFGSLFLFFFFPFSTFIQWQRDLDNSNLDTEIWFDSRKEYIRVLLIAISIELLLLCLFMLILVPFSIIFFTLIVCIILITEYLEINSNKIKFLNKLKKLLYIPTIILWWLIIPYEYLIMMALFCGLVIIGHVLFIDKYVIKKLLSYRDYCKDNKEKELNLKVIKEYFYE